MSKSRICFDIETDGHLYEFTKIHCICTKDMDTLETNQFRPDEIEDGLNLLTNYDILIGHNICQYDIPGIKKLYPRFSYGALRDSLCMSRMFDPERPLHGLEDYGRQFKRYKPYIENWEEFSEEKVHRCSEDVEINFLTYNYLVEKFCKDWSWLKALEIEQDFALYRAGQVLEGVDVDEQLAKELLERIDKEIDYLDSVLLDKIPHRILPVGNIESGCKPFKKDGNFTVDTIKWFGL